MVWIAESHSSFSNKCPTGKPHRVGGVVARLFCACTNGRHVGPPPLQGLILIELLWFLFAGMVSKILWRALWISTRFPYPECLLPVEL